MRTKRAERRRAWIIGLLGGASLAAVVASCGGDGGQGPLEERGQTASPVTVEGFFGTPKPSGTVTLTLRPTEVVSASQPTTVTFGVPFPRGSISDPAKIRVLKNGTEIPAYVDVATPWRSITQPSINGASIRVARVQI